MLCSFCVDLTLRDQGADDGWVEFDRTDAFTINRTLYNTKMSFKNINHLYTFVRRLESVVEAKKVRLYPPHVCGAVANLT